MNNKINLLGLSHESLVDFFHNIGQPSFRANQFLKWVHQRGCLNFDEMTDFNIPLREKLKENSVHRNTQNFRVKSSQKMEQKNLL